MKKTPVGFGTGEALRLVLVHLLAAAFLVVAVAGGYAMGRDRAVSAVDVVVAVEPFPNQGQAVTREKVESAAREILERLFPQDYARSAQIRGKVSRAKAAGKTADFELDALFLYRETYTAVTHKVLFSLTGNGYAVVSVDGGK